MEKVHKIHERCKGCNHIINEDECSHYINPCYWWEVFGGKACPCATHLTKEELAEIRKINPIKRSKKFDRRPHLRQGKKSAKEWTGDGIRTPKRKAYR